jgi:membrane protease YdiL (CAAX protease family)
MAGTHILADHIFFALYFITGPLVDRFCLWPHLVRAIAAGNPRARMRFYRINLGFAWASTACILALWIILPRPWPGLLLVPASLPRFAIGIILAGAFCGLLWKQRRDILTRPDRFDRMRCKLGHFDPLLPHTPAEFRVFQFVAVTAGICEELLFRGYAYWYVGGWSGHIVALVAAAILFGYAHIYQGMRRALDITILGLILGVIAVVSGSLLPVILMHAAQDLVGGELGYRALNQAPLPADPGSEAEATS